MNIILDQEEFNRWFKSAKLTLESAIRDYEHGDYNWACFKAHQAVEKALKALLWGIGKPRIGHALNRLIDYIRELDFEIPDEIIQACYKLTKHYIPTRYPDAWSEGIPEEYYTKDEAQEAIQQALKVLNWVENVWKKLLEKEKI